jgi:hypothetical protein
MKRGIIIITKEEVLELVAKFPMEIIKNTQLEVKLRSAKKLTVDQKDMAEVRLELSQEEIEILLDEIGIPSVEDTPAIFEIRKKLNAGLALMRNE